MGAVIFNKVLNVRLLFHVIDAVGPPTVTTPPEQDRLFSHLSHGLWASLVPLPCILTHFSLMSFANQGSADSIRKND